MKKIEFESMPELLLRHKRSGEGFANKLEAFAKMVGMVSHRPIKRDFSCADLDALVADGVVSVLMIDVDLNEVVGLIEGQILPTSNSARVCLRVRNLHLARHCDWIKPDARLKGYRLLKKSLIQSAVKVWRMEQLGAPAPECVELRFYGRTTERYDQLSTALVPVKQTRR